MAKLEIHARTAWKQSAGGLDSRARVSYRVPTMSTVAAGTGQASAHARIVAAWRSSARVRALQMLWQASRPLTLAAAVFVFADGVLPNLALIMVGRVTGFIPAAVAHGLSSPAGTRMLRALAVAGVAFAVSLLRGPAEDALAAATRARVSNVLQRRLVEACRPPPESGISKIRPSSTSSPPPRAR